MIRPPPTSTLFPYTTLFRSMTFPILASLLVRLVVLLPLTKCDSYLDRKSGSAGMPRPISYAVFCLKKKIHITLRDALGGRMAQDDITQGGEVSLEHTHAADA